jgi:hypothetical protein
MSSPGQRPHLLAAAWLRAPGPAGAAPLLSVTHQCPAGCAHCPASQLQGREGSRQSPTFRSGLAARVGVESQIHSILAGRLGWSRHRTWGLNMGSGGCGNVRKTEINLGQMLSHCDRLHASNIVQLRQALQCRPCGCIDCACAAQKLLVHALGPSADAAAVARVAPEGDHCKLLARSHRVRVSAVAHAFMWAVASKHQVREVIHFTL